MLLHVGPAKTQLRGLGTQLPLGEFVTRDGHALYGAPGRGAGIGDFFFVAKALLRDAPPASNGTRVAARIGLNVSGASEFAEGNFVGVGASLDKKLMKWAAFHGDVRANLALDRVSEWNLPLRRSSFGFSGPAASRQRQLAGVQIDGNSTISDRHGRSITDYGSITIGLGHRFRTGRTAVVSQIYARENMNLPFSVRWNTDPDASFGIKITLRPISR